MRKLSIKFMSSLLSIKQRQDIAMRWLPRFVTQLAGPASQSESYLAQATNRKPKMSPVPPFLEV